MSGYGNVDDKGKICFLLSLKAFQYFWCFWDIFKIKLQPQWIINYFHFRTDALLIHKQSSTPRKITTKHVIENFADDLTMTLEGFSLLFLYTLRAFIVVSLQRWTGNNYNIILTSKFLVSLELKMRLEMLLFSI